MSRVRASPFLLLGVAILVASCASSNAMSDVELAECTDAALSEGTIGGSEVLVSTAVLLLPEDVIPPTGTPDEIEAAFDAAFVEAYGISVDGFLTLREDADAATTARLGEPPGVGEHVSDEWFVERDSEMMVLWNERHPESARTFCDLVQDGTRETS